MYAILKKGDPTLITNYSSISILSNFCKMLFNNIYNSVGTSTLSSKKKIYIDKSCKFHPIGV